MESHGGFPILNNIRLGLTKKVTLGRLGRGEVSNVDAKREDIQTEGTASAKVLKH